MKPFFTHSSLIKVTLKKQQVADWLHLSFTGDAIAVCGAFLQNGRDIDLDEWEWRKERRGSEDFYIITELKNNTGSLSSRKES